MPEFATNPLSDSSIILDTSPSAFISIGLPKAIYDCVLAGIVFANISLFLRLISKNVNLYTEMIVAKAIIKGNRDRLLRFNPKEKPLALQIGGSNPKELAEACKVSEDYGYKEINFNLGCPSKKVQKNKFGACLMQEPDLVAKCIDAMSNSTKLPITIKTRIGYNDVEDFEFLKKFIQTTKNAGSKKFIVHARRAILKKLSPKENLNIPPLKYDFVSVFNSLVLRALIELDNKLGHFDYLLLEKRSFPGSFVL